MTSPTPTAMKEQLSDLLDDISWATFAKRYFGKSSTWFYFKRNGVDGKNRPCRFTPEEKERLRASLLDLAERIRQTAEGIH